MTQAALCPACGSRDVVPVIHGMPDDEAEAAARRGEVVLGGCMIWPEKPIWHCRACEREFGMMKELENDG
jgi:DNA-directed RNA polymerase subunit RPC12/RpoP